MTCLHKWVFQMQPMRVHQMGHNKKNKFVDVDLYYGDIVFEF